MPHAVVTWSVNPSGAAAPLLYVDHVLALDVGYGMVAVVLSKAPRHREAVALLRINLLRYVAAVIQRRSGEVHVRAA